MKYLVVLAFLMANYWWLFAVLAGISGILRLALGNISII